MRSFSLAGRRLAPALAAWLGFAGCSPDPTIAILEPVGETTVCGTPLQVAIDVQDFEIVPFDETDVGDHSGHVDVHLNGQVAAMSLETTFAIDHVPDGMYRLDAELVTSNHEPLDPPSTDSVTFEVDAAACGD